MNKLYIFGASKLGEIAYILFKEAYKIQGFIDNDHRKQNETFCNLPIYSPSIIESINAEIIIASSYWEEIEKQLLSSNFHNYKILNLDITQPNLRTSEVIGNELKLVSAGALITSIPKKLLINDLTFSNGGSTLMDYYFLKAVAIKLEAKTFLEIGTWTGESVASVAEVVDHCYSISLPDNDLSLIKVFNKYCNKENFSRFFSRGIDNITHFEGNSLEFDYDQLPFQIDLIFIDGDHSYQGISADSKNVFERYGYEDTVIIWHDFKTARNELVKVTYEAVNENIPIEYKGNLFAVQGNFCGIYIPKRYWELFNFDEKKTELYSYEINMMVKVNNI